MPALNINLPNFTAEDLDDAAQRRRIVSYMYSLHEQLQYLLTHLDEDNLSDGLKETINVAYEAIKTVTADVIELKAPAKRVQTLGSEVLIDENRVRIATPEFMVEINESGQIFLLDDSGGVMADLSVTNQLTAPNMAEKYTGLDTVTVGPGGTYGSLAEFSRAVNNKLLPMSVTATLTADLTEDALLTGMHGTGQLTIDGDGHTLTGGMNIRNAGVTVQLMDMIIMGTTYVSDNSIVLMDDMVLNDGLLALSIFRGGRVRIRNSELQRAATGIWMDTGAWLSAINMTGLDSNKVCIEAYDSAITWRGTRMAGTVSVTACLTTPADISSLTEDGSVNPPPPAHVTTDTFTPSMSATSYGNGHWSSESRMRQGFNGVEQRGCMWFDLSSLAGHTIRSASLTLTRVPGKGRSSAIALTLYTTNLTGKTQGANPADSKANELSLGSIGNGETITVSIPTASLGDIMTALLAGKGLMLYTGETTAMSGKDYSANYGHIYGEGESGEPVLTVTYE